MIGGHPASQEQFAQRRARKKRVDNQNLLASFDFNPGDAQPAEGKRTA
jgi:hypothetical protein